MGRWEEGENEMNYNKLLENDEFGILPEGNQIPYISFYITKEQYEKIITLKPVWYETNGQKLFKVKDKNGNETDEYVMFLLFVP